MGCFTSTLNLTEAPDPKKYRKMTNSEETKNPESYRKSSIDARPQSKMSLPRKSSKAQASTAEETHIVQPQSRKNTTFDLNKDLIGLLQSELAAGNEGGRQEPSELSEQDYTYKLTKEQHRQIYEFVRDKHSIFQSTINKLYQNLAKNTEENDALYEIIENLKSYDKDIRNCKEDLQTYQISNEKKLYAEFERNHQFIISLIVHYELFRAKEQSYENFKDNVMNLTVDYNKNRMEKPSMENGNSGSNYEEKSQVHELWDFRGTGKKIVITEKYMDNLTKNENGEKSEETEKLEKENKPDEEREVVENREEDALEKGDRNCQGQDEIKEVKVEEIEVLTSKDGKENKMERMKEESSKSEY